MSGGSEPALGYQRSSLGRCTCPCMGSYSPIATHTVKNSVKIYEILLESVSSGILEYQLTFSDFPGTVSIRMSQEDILINENMEEKTDFNVNFGSNGLLSISREWGRCSLTLVPVRVGRNWRGLGKVVVLQGRARQQSRVWRPVREQGKLATDCGWGFCRKGPLEFCVRAVEIALARAKDTAPPEKLSRWIHTSQWA